MLTLLYGVCIRLTVHCLGVHNSITRSGDVPSWGLLSWAVGQLEFLDQVLGCGVGMAWSTGLHRGYAGCCRCRCRHRGNFGDSWCLWFKSRSHCGCNGWRLQQLCRLDWCRQWHRNVRSAGSCSVAVVTSEVVSVGLMLCSWRCHLVWQ